MKKIVALITMMILAAQVFAAGTRSNKPRDLITVERKVEQFNRIKVSGSLELVVVTGKEQRVMVTCESKILHQIETSVNVGELSIAITGVMKFKNLTENCKIEVWVEDLKSLNVSGVTNVFFPEKATMENFSISTSGVSKTTFADLEVTGKFTSEASGASRVDITGNLGNASFEGSGACNLFFTGNAATLNLEVSGACKTSINAETERMDIEASGACRITLTGHTQLLRLEAAGASSVRSERFRAENRQASFSGAAKISIVD